MLSYGRRIRGREGESVKIRGTMCRRKEYTDITNVTYCDGEYYWDSTVIYYFEYYDVVLDGDFVKKVVG